jgi:hypothetical protein
LVRHHRARGDAAQSGRTWENSDQNATWYAINTTARTRVNVAMTGNHSIKKI